MIREEEKISKRIVLMDTLDAKLNHLRMLALSILIGTVYGFFLLILSSTRPEVLSALILFGSQIALGFPVSKAYYDLGVTNREKLHFVDPVKFNGKQGFYEVNLRVGDLPLFFEKIDLHVRRYDTGRFDDLSDLAWFAIFVWAAISATTFYLGTDTFPQFLVGTIVLLTACIGSYLSGYWTGKTSGFEDDVSHLQYYVEKHLKEIDQYLPKNDARTYIQLLERRRTSILIDFSVEVKLGEAGVLEYHMGAPSNTCERIVVKAADEILESVLQKAKENHDWNSERIITAAGPIVRILNESSSFSVTKRTSFVASPSVIDESSRITSEVFSSILSSADKSSPD